MAREPAGFNTGQLEGRLQLAVGTARSWSWSPAPDACWAC